MRALATRRGITIASGTQRRARVGANGCDEDGWMASQRRLRSGRAGLGTVARLRTNDSNE